MTTLYIRLNGIVAQVMSDTFCDRSLRNAYCQCNARESFLLLILPPYVISRCISDLTRNESGNTPLGVGSEHHVSG